jgi:transcription initiation factor IIF auxiliary subunit
MRKLIFVLTIVLSALNLQAVPRLAYDGKQTDTVKLVKQITKLKLKLAELNNELTETQNQIPVDSVKLESALSKSHEAQMKSKKRSGQAVGGDMDDVKLAEKQAKIARKATSEAEDASKQLERDHKKVKKLAREIEKNQKKLDEIQAPGN